jgi:hypothetical protein
MTAFDWIVLLAGAGAAAALAWWIYGRRELPGQGRGLLAGLRWAALALVLLVLVDPVLPRPGRAAEAPPVVIIDASLSMLLPVEPGAEERRWDAAVREARRQAGGRAVLLAGRQTRAVSADSLPLLQPDAPGSRLLPALQAAAEAGARRVVVISDGGVEDGRAVAGWAPRLGLAVEVRQVVRQAMANRSLAELQAPEWAESGRPVEIEFGVAAVGLAGEPVRVVARQDGQELADTSVTSPADGRVSSGVLRLTPRPPPGGGWVRLEIGLEPGDAVPDDDTRVVRIFVTDEPAGVALVSFRPDWELRFLQPVLARSLGVPVRGYLRSEPGSYLRTGIGQAAGVAAGEDEVRRAVERADLVVLHGVGTDVPGWARDALQRERRLLVFPGADAAGLPAPFGVPAAVANDWVPSGDVPASPMAAVLAGVDVGEAPPLQALHPPPQVPGWTPLHLSAGGRGAPMPAVWAGEQAGRRWAIALGAGYWSWAFRGDASRDLYSRLFGGLAGWLLAGQVTVDGVGVRPAERVIVRGEPVRWLAPGLRPDSMAIRLTAADGSLVTDTVLRAAVADTLALDGVPPGDYAYEATAFAEGSVAGRGTGEMTVEWYSPEYARPAADLQLLTAAATPLRAVPPEGRPLRASPWPYVLIIGILITEWVLRRRWGLR